MIVLKPNKCTFFTKQILGLVAILFLVSCNSKKEKVPKNLISQEMMSHILADIKVIDAAFQAGVGPISIDSAKLDSAKLDSLDSIHNSSNTKVSLYERVKTAMIQEADSLAGKNVTSQNDSLDSDINYEPVDYAPPSNDNIYRGHLGADYDFVFKKYKVTREEFDKSLEYYSQKPEVFYLITERALSILSEYLIQVKPVVTDVTDSTTVQEVVK